MAHRLSHGTQRPMGCTTRCRFQRQTDRFGNLIIADLARPPRLIQKPVKPALRIATSSRPCSRIQRRRARATSARCRSVARRLFFEGDVMTLEEPPQRAPAAANSPFAQRCEQFLEGGIRLFFNQPQYRYPMFFQPGCAPSTPLWRHAARFTPMLPPFHRCAHRNPEKLGCFMPRYSGCNRFNHAFAQISRIGFRHALTPS